MRRATAVLLATVLAATGLAACSRDPGPGPTLDAFLAGWRTGGSLAAVGFVAPDGSGVAADTVAAEIKSLSGELAGTPPTTRVAGKPRVSGDLATVDVSLAWPLGPDISWDYPTTVQLSRNRDRKWQVIWAPTVIHPALKAGDVLATTRVPAPRAGIVDAAGTAIVTDRPVYHVGVEPGKVTDQAELIRGLSAGLKTAGADVSLADLPDRLRAARPTDFVEVVLLREEPFLRARGQLEPVDGVFFRRDTRPLAESREFARALLGTVDEVTKEIMDARPGVFQVGDMTGLSGLQRRYDDRLRGRPGRKVLATRKAADGTVTSTELWQAAPKPGTPLKISLDTAVQRAAEGALRGGTRRAAIAAVRPSDGSVLALANFDPADGAVNLALEAQVPPGSTFKMVTAYGVLDNGSVTIDTPVACPATATVAGMQFRNAHNLALGTVPFRTDFARSCNTAFVGLAPRLGPSGLADAAKALGIGVPWDLGATVYSGSVATGGSAADQAAAAFGQGRTLVSPVALAGAAAAVASGQWKQPKLVLDPAPASPAAAGPQLKASTVDPLRQMMREVVTASGGTGAALADVPGDVRGKTGTAEFDNTNPNRTHAWFIGYRGDVAFAVFVEEGGDSTDSAVPLAEKFLRALPA